MGVKLDGIWSLGTTIHNLCKENPVQELVIYKTDVAEAYCLCPMHPLWQLKQVVSVDSVKHVDCCNNFGGRASQKIYHSVASLIVWIAVFKRGIMGLKCYVDDHFGIAHKTDVSWYAP